MQIMNHKIMQDSDNKSKASWNIINNQMGLNTLPQMIKMVNVNNKSVTDPHQIANCFNNHFIDSLPNASPTTSNQTGDLYDHITTLQLYFFRRSQKTRYAMRLGH